MYIMQNYTTLHQNFLIFNNSSKNYNSYPKISTKSSATVAFGRKVPKGYSFKKVSQLNLYFSIAMWCCGCSSSQTFVFNSLALSYWIRWHCDIKLPLLHSVHPTLSAGSWTSYQIFKKGGLDRTSTLWGELLEKRGVTFFRWDYNFSQKIN